MTFQDFFVDFQDFPGLFWDLIDFKDFSRISRTSRTLNAPCLLVHRAQLIRKIAPEINSLRPHGRFLFKYNLESH